MADHDQRLKTLLREFFPEFLALALPDWVDRFDFGQVEWLLQEVFPDPPQGQRRAVDLVARLSARLSLPGQEHGGPQQWITLIHVEVASEESVEPLRRRVFEYHRHLEHKHGLPVLSVGLYLRVGLEGLGWDVYEKWYWEHRLLRFEYPYVGLPALDAFQHVQGPNLLAVGLSALMRVADDRRAELKAEAMQRTATAPLAEYRRHLLCECVEAYLPLEGPHLTEYEHLLRTERYQEARMIGQTSYEKGLEQGLARGQAQAQTSYEKGLEQGLAQGQQGLLRRQLERRFGALGPTAQERLAACSPERLLELGEALLTAASLRDLGLED